VYVWSPEEEGLFKPGRCSRWWLHQSLKAFEKDLAALGTSMLYRRSQESRQSLVQLVQETGAQVSITSSGVRLNFLLMPCPKGMASGQYDIRSYVIGLAWQGQAILRRSSVALQSAWWYAMLLP